MKILGSFVFAILILSAPGTARADAAARQMSETRKVCIRMLDDYTGAVTRKLADFRKLSVEFGPDGTMDAGVFHAVDHHVRMRMARLTWIWIGVNHPSRVTAKGCREFLLNEASNVFGYVNEAMATENMPGLPLPIDGNRDGTTGPGPTREEMLRIFTN